MIHVYLFFQQMPRTLSEAQTTSRKHVCFKLLAEMLASFQQNLNTSPSVLVNYDPMKYFRGGKKSINKSAHFFYFVCVVLPVIFI